MRMTTSGGASSTSSGKSLGDRRPDPERGDRLKLDLKNYRIQDQSREMFLLLTTNSNDEDVRELSQSVVSAGFEEGGKMGLKNSIASVRENMIERAGGSSARSEALTALAIRL